MKQTKTSSGKIIFWIFLVVFAWILITHFAQTKNIVNVLLTGKWYWVAIAVVLQLLYYPFYAHFASFIFSIFRVKLGFAKNLQLYVASKFTDVALPIATVGQVAIFVRNAKKEKLSPLNVGIGISFILFSEVLAFSTLAVITLIILHIAHEPRAYLYITALILAAVAFIAILFLIQLSIFQCPPNRFITWVIKTISHLFGQKSVKMEEIEEIFLEIGKDLVDNRKKLWPGFYYALGTHIINLLTFAFIYLAFADHINILAIMAGYVAGLLYTIVSITPQGVGVAEAVMVTTLRSFGLDISTAAVITLAFRGLLYWLPLFAGFYVFSHLELKNETTE